MKVSYTGILGYRHGFCVDLSASMLRRLVLYVFFFGGVVCAVVFDLLAIGDLSSPSYVDQLFIDSPFFRACLIGVLPCALQHMSECGIA